MRTKVPPPKESSSVVTVPIYDVKLMIVVSDDPLRSRLRRSGYMGEHDGGEFSGQLEYRGHRFLLTFERKYLCHELIAHEVFHATHRILEFCAVRFDQGNPEPFPT